MSDGADSERPRHFVARHPVASFLFLAYAITAVTAAVPFLTRRDLLPFEQAPMDWLGHLLGSAGAAFLVVGAIEGRAGVRDLAARCLRWRVAPRWYAITLLGVPVFSLVLATLFPDKSPIAELAAHWPVLFTDVIPRLIVLIVFSNVAEEVGWTGFLFDRTQRRFSPLKASLIVSVPFALSHIPGWIVESGSLSEAAFLTAVLFIPQAASRVVVAWIYNNTARSILLVGLFHCSFNVTGAEFARRYISTSGEVIFEVTSTVVVVAAIVVAVTTKGNLGHRDRNEPTVGGRVGTTFTA